MLNILRGYYANLTMQKFDGGQALQNSVKQHII